MAESILASTKSHDWKQYINAHPEKLTVSPNGINLTLRVDGDNYFEIERDQQTAQATKITCFFQRRVVKDKQFNHAYILGAINAIQNEYTSLTCFFAYKNLTSQSACHTQSTFNTPAVEKATPLPPRVGPYHEKNEFGLFKIRDESSNIWYIDPVRKFAPVRRLAQWESSAKDIRAKDKKDQIGGTSSYIGNRDEYYIELLKREDSKEYSKKHAMESHEIVRTLGIYKYIVPSIIVERDLVIARNAGIEVLSGIVQKNRSIQVCQFEGVSRDLKHLNDYDIYLRDIHTANMAVSNLNAPVKIIDTSDAIDLSSESDSYKTDRCSPCYSTLDISYARMKKSIYGFKAGDRYGLAISICESTDQTGKIYDAIEYSTISPIYRDAKYQSTFDSWIQQHVLPEYQMHFKFLLRNPLAFVEQYNLHIYQMINWDTGH